MSEEKTISGRTGPSSLNRHMFNGSVWMILLRWTIRLTGLVSTVILARLLVPSDFGIVAMAMFVVGLLELLNQSGQKLALIRHHNPTREDYDTAWTLSLIVCCIIALLVWAAAPISAHYFREPRITLVMRWLALRSLLGGFENIGVIDFRRDLKFNWSFLYGICPKLVSLVVTVAAAAIWRNYFALVAGMITAQLAMNVMSFAMHSYRPRFSLAKLSEMGSFSSWALARATGNYLNSQIDQIAVGGLLGSGAMGRYSVATDLASSPSKEINDPMVAVLYPVMSRARSDPSALRRLYLHTFGWSAIICLSAALGVTMVAHDLVHLVLGEKWADVEPLMGWLALGTGMLGLSSGAYATFDAIGKPHLGAKMQWARLIILVVALIPISVFLGTMTAIAVGRLVMIAAFIPTLLLTVGREIGISPKDYAGALWRPVMASCLMVLVLQLVNNWLAAGNMRLLLDVLLGTFTFGGSLLLAWCLTDKPEGPEKDIWGAALGAFTDLRVRSVKLRGMLARDSGDV